jgi:hypothetical protein
MTKRFIICMTIVAAALLWFMSPIPPDWPVTEHAQGTPGIAIEQACPSGIQPAGGFGVTLDPTTQQYRQGICIDTAGNLIFNGKLNKSGLYFQHARFGATNATAASAGAVANTAYSWVTGFGDLNYTGICMGIGPTGTPVVSSATFTQNGVTVQITAITAVASSFSSVNCIAFHD